MSLLFPHRRRSAVGREATKRPGQAPGPHPKGRNAVKDPANSRVARAGAPGLAGSGPIADHGCKAGDTDVNQARTAETIRPFDPVGVTIVKRQKAEFRQFSRRPTDRLPLLVPHSICALAGLPDRVWNAVDSIACLREFA